jgi:peptidoglycan lytic transglycosylase G
VGKGDLPADLIARQLKAFEQSTVDLPWGNTKALGITAYQAVIVASLIEKEVSVPQERAKVAAVIYNRLHKKMSLGFDSTVRYALKKWTGPLTKSDLAVDSPYNTRKVLGLPPSPIASPGLAALQAALEPAKVDYLYFVLQATTKRLYFTNNYQDFLKAAKDAAPE